MTVQNNIEENEPQLTQSVLELLTVATEFCRQVEREDQTTAQDLINVMLILLPMVYLKTSLVNDAEPVDGFNENRVTEGDYNLVRNRIAAILGDQDSYLDVFVQEFKYSDRPILCTVSEDLADMYQALREFVECYRWGNEEVRQVALADLKENFKLYWGQKLLNALRAIHDIKYGDKAFDEESE